MSIKNYLETIRNPFTLGREPAKVPDGKARLSLGDRQQARYCWKIEMGKGVLLLSPNYTCAFATYQSVAPNNYRTDVEFFEDEIHTLEMYGYDFYKKAGAPDKWRLVSAGVRLTNVCTSESNDGWFEAIRIRSARTANNFFLAGPDPIWSVYEDPLEFEGGLLKPGSDWSNDPSYTRGRLADIHKWVFYLQCSGKRDFKSLPLSWYDDMDLLDVDTWQLKLGGVTPSIIMDEGFDSVAVRIFSTSGVGLPSTDILVHSVHNFEGEYDSGSSFSKFQSVCLNDRESVVLLDEEINRDVKAGRICADYETEI
jgi:hypothetical protein